ncbi:MAG TPA: MFS transporter [Gemmatimonadales bacterium]|jgi:MFS family permease
MTRLLVLFVTAFVDMVGLTMIVPLLPYYARDFGAGAATVGLLISAFSVAQLAVAPLWGRTSDRLGRRPAILAGLIITALAYVLFAFAGSVPLLLLARVIQGIGGGTIGVVQAYVADVSAPDQRTKSLGWLSAITSLGAVAGPAFGSLMVALGGQEFVGLGAAGLALLVALFAWGFLRESRRQPTPATHAAQLTTGRAAIRHVLSRWREPAPKLIWIYAVGIGAFYGTIQIVPLLLADRLGVTEHTVGYFVMYLGAMGVVVRALVLGRAVDRLGEARLARLGIILLAAGLVFTGIGYGSVVLAAGFTLMPLGTAFLFPCVTGLLSQAVPGRERGLYMGVQHTFGGVSRVVFPIAAGLLMDHFGVGVPFWLAGVLVLLTLPLTGSIAPHPAPAPSTATEDLRIAAADITGEIPTPPRA